MNIKIDSFFRNSQGEADVNFSVDGKFNQVKAYREFGKWRVYDQDTAQRDIDVKIQRGLNELIAHWGEDQPEATKFNASGSKYLRGIQCTPEGKIDVYAVLIAFNVVSPARQHAIKKLLCAGLREKGSEYQDVCEALDAIERDLQLMESKQ